MHDIALIPGAGHLANSLWPLQALDSPTIFPVDYRRGFINGERDELKPVLQQYADRAFVEILQLDRPVDLYAHSMGAPVALGVIQRADKEAPGLVRKLIAINPGVFHGPPKTDFHRSISYAMKLLFPSSEGSRVTAKALEKIRATIPEFNCKVDEFPLAMVESGDGVMRIPRGFDRKRLVIYYSPDDEIIPAEITLHIAKKIRRTATAIPGFGHMLPLHDTDGTILEQIRSKNL